MPQSLIFVDDSLPGINRRKLRNHWAYFDPKGERITQRDEIDRLNRIGLPPAYTDTWFAPSGQAHILATGIAAGCAPAGLIWAGALVEWRSPTNR